AVNGAFNLPAFQELESAADLHGVICGNKNQRVIFQSFRERCLGAVVSRPRDAVRILLVSRLGLDAPIGVEPDLMNVGKYSQQGVRKPAAESAGPLKGNRNGNGRFHNKISRALPRKVQDGCLAWEETAFGSANH